MCNENFETGAFYDDQTVEQYLAECEYKQEMAPRSRIIQIVAAKHGLTVIDLPVSKVEPGDSRGLPVLDDTIPY